MADLTGKEPVPAVGDEASRALPMVVKGNTVFALNLYGELQEQEGNLFFSPYSLSTALAMTYGGARGNTEAQMAEVLHVSVGQEQLHPAFAALQDRLQAVQDEGDVRLNVANTLWPQREYPFVEEYLALIEEYYGVHINAVDYVRDAEGARTRINAWVEEQTENKISNLIPRGVLTALTRLVLVNAIYFKGHWASQFDPSLTSEAPFWMAPDQQVLVPMMAQQGEFGYAEWDGLQALEMPYVGDGLSMIVLLPREVDGLGELEAALSPENLERWTRNLRKREVQVFFPRFEMAADFRLDGALATLGMIDAFDDAKADFSGMDGQKPWLYIGAVLHKAFVELNEEGTEAAAATAVIMLALGLPLPPPTFRADRPFLFLIRENLTGSLLFLGRMVNPAPEGG
jgi:serpin B